MIFSELLSLQFPSKLCNLCWIWSISDNFLNCRIKRTGIYSWIPLTNLTLTRQTKLFYFIQSYLHITVFLSEGLLLFSDLMLQDEFVSTDEKHEPNNGREVIKWTSLTNKRQANDKNYTQCFIFLSRFAGNIMDKRNQN